MGPPLPEDAEGLQVILKQNGLAALDAVLEDQSL